MENAYDEDAATLLMIRAWQQYNPPTEALTATFLGTGNNSPSGHAQSTYVSQTQFH